MAARRARKALYPGSFDPVTRGHLDVLAKALELFDTVFVAVIENPQKTPLLSIEERIALLRREIGARASVRVLAFSGLTVDAAARVGARWIVRGLRSGADAAYELPMAYSNRVCGRTRIETIFIPSSPETSFISSSLVREIAARGGRLEEFVTPAVARALRGRVAAK